MSLIKRMLGIGPEWAFGMSSEDARTRRDVNAYAAKLSPSAGAAVREIFSSIERATQRRETDGGSWWFSVSHSSSPAEASVFCNIPPILSYLDRHGIRVQPWFTDIEIKGRDDAPEGTYGAMLNSHHATYLKRAESENRLAPEGP